MSEPVENPTLLLERLERALGGSPLGEALGGTEKAIVFINQAPQAAARHGLDVTAAQRALDKLRNSGHPTADELALLGQCIRYMRPALLVQDHRLGPSPRFNPTSAQRKHLEALLPGIGAIGHAGKPTGVGTGFLVGPRALLTNKHVVTYLGGENLSPGKAVVHFGLEHDRPELLPVIAVTRVLALHPSQDIALLELAEDGPHPGLPVARTPLREPGRQVLTVGHPDDDPVRNPYFIPDLFDDIFRVKRASPGELTGVEGEWLLHDCSTLGGNSGSPVIDCERGTVIGVHFRGSFSKQNRAVMTSALATCPEIQPHIRFWD